MYWITFNFNKPKLRIPLPPAAASVVSSRFFFKNAVYNLHRKGTIRFFTRGAYCVELIDKDGLRYLIGSQRADELTTVLQKEIKE